MLMRHAEENDLVVALPKQPISYMGYPLHFSPQRDMLDFDSVGVKPNIMAVHMRFNHTAVQQVGTPH